MAEEFVIKSQTIEDKINQLLPSQGGFQPGVDFSASTMVMPIIDLTETAEGSQVRADLQTSFSLIGATNTRISNGNTVLINTPGYFRIFGTYSCIESGGSATLDSLSITDGTTTKNIISFLRFGSSTVTKQIETFDFNILLQAGDSFQGATNSTNSEFSVTTQQIADLSGNLT